MQRLSGKTPWRNVVKKAKLKARPASTYRGARRIASRGNRRCDLLKEERELTGETRRQMDARREAMRKLREMGSQMRATTEQGSDVASQVA